MATLSSINEEGSILTGDEGVNDETEQHLILADSRGEQVEEYQDNRHH